MAEKFKARSVAMFTLGVADLERSIKFYEAIGFPLSPDSDPKMCTFVCTNNISIGLVEYNFLANDIGMEVDPPQKYKGFTAAINGLSPEEVDSVFNLAVEAGATPYEVPHWKDWGGYPGYSGYFLDPDGYTWEVAYAPTLKTDENRVLQPTWP